MLKKNRNSSFRGFSICGLRFRKLTEFCSDAGEFVEPCRDADQFICFSGKFRSNPLFKFRRNDGRIFQ